MKVNRFITATAASLCMSVMQGVNAAEPAPPIGAGVRPVGQEWSRSPGYASNGMAATAQPLASQIAIDILKKGGTAVDAAIAANAALGLMEPTGNGIGGDLFAIVWDPKSAKLYGINGSGRAPVGRSLEETRAQSAAIMGEGKGIPPFGHLPVSVPGAVDAWFELHSRFGKLPIKTILAPAIDYAETGFPVSPVIAEYFARNLKRFEDNQAMIGEFANARATYFAKGAPKAGEIFKNPDLAHTYRLIAKGGSDAFYRGPIAEMMDGYMKRIGGALRYRDFAEHASEWVDPGCVDYRGHSVCELPPNGQGFAALEMLNILKNADLKKWPRGSAEVIHLIVEAKRLAFEDLAKFYADPAFQPAPVEWLLSEEYGKERFALIDMRRAARAPAPGTPPAGILEHASDTTYLTVADKVGMMVSLIQSNYRGMGSGLVPDGLGFMLQDRGELFSLNPDHPNAYHPGKRPFQTIIPAFVLKDGKPWLSFGVMGGGMQPQGHVQILVNLIDYGMNLQEAGDAARVHHDGGRQPTGVDLDAMGTLDVEPGIPAETVARLKSMGHKVRVLEDGTAFGGYQAIMRDPATGVYAGATEMRKDGAAIGY